MPSRGGTDSGAHYERCRRPDSYLPSRPLTRRRPAPVAAFIYLKTAVSLLPEPRFPHSRDDRTPHEFGCFTELLYLRSVLLLFVRSSSSSTIAAAAVTAAVVLDHRRLCVWPERYSLFAGDLRNGYTIIKRPLLFLTLFTTGFIPPDNATSLTHFYPLLPHSISVFRCREKSRFTRGRSDGVTIVYLSHNLFVTRGESAMFRRGKRSR